MSFKDTRSGHGWSNGYFYQIGESYHEQSSYDFLMEKWRSGEMYEYFKMPLCRLKLGFFGHYTVIGQTFGTISSCKLDFCKDSWKNKIIKILVVSFFKR
jgi:hypothetical protein